MKTPTIQQDLKTLMDGWNVIEAAAKKEYPTASTAELFQISKSAMNQALGWKSTQTNSYLVSPIVGAPQ